MSWENYQILERGIKELLEGLGGVLSETESAEVIQFVNVGEYGVALETLCGILVEEQYVVDRDALGKIEELGTSMSLDGEFWQRIKTGGGK